MYRSKEEVQRDLEPYEAAFERIPREAWAIYEDKHRDLRGQYIVPLVQPVLLHNYMVVVSRATLSHVPGITLSVPGAPYFFINVENKYIIKPRLLYSNFAVATNFTTLGLTFEDQEPGQLSLSGMPEQVTYLHLGYRTNRTKSSYTSIHIVCLSGIGQKAWEWTLSAAAPGEQPIPFPVQPPQDGGPLVRRRKPAPVPEEAPTEEPAEHGTDA